MFIIEWGYKILLMGADISNESIVIQWEFEKAVPTRTRSLHLRSASLKLRSSCLTSSSISLEKKEWIWPESSWLTGFNSGQLFQELEASMSSFQKKLKWLPLKGVLRMNSLLEGITLIVPLLISAPKTGFYSLILWWTLVGRSCYRFRRLK